MTDYSSHGESGFEDDPGPLDDMIDEDADDLKLDNSETRVWLVKLPKFIAEKWNAIDQDDVDLGTIRIYDSTVAGRPGEISLMLPENVSDDIPREYNIRMNKLQEVNNKFVLTEDENGNRSVSGKVYHECYTTPKKSTAGYRAIMRKRVQEAERPQRTVQTLGQDNQPVFAPGASSSMSVAPFSNFVTSKRSKTDKEKATRMPHNELMDLLFAAFERYPYWSFKGIIEHTNQPAQYLKDILAEICILNKRGPYAGNYQIKPEFKQPSTAEGSGHAASGDDDADPDEDEEDEEEMETIL